MAVRSRTVDRGHARAGLADAHEAPGKLREACTVAPRQDSVQCLVGSDVRGSVALRAAVGNPVAGTDQVHRQIRLVRTSARTFDQAAASMGRKGSGLDHLRWRVWQRCTPHEATMGPGRARRMRRFRHRIFHEADRQQPRWMADEYPRQGRRYGWLAGRPPGTAVSVWEKGLAILRERSTDRYLVTRRRIPAGDIIFQQGGRIIA